MSHLSIALAIPLIAGLAGGVLINAPVARPMSLLVAAGWVATMLGFVAHRPRLQLAGLVGAVLAVGWLLGAHAIDRAMHAPLRTLLEQRLGGFAMEATVDGRSEAPIMIEGRLREDAALTESGAVVRIAVDRVWIGPCPESTEGGVSIGVGGTLQAEYLRQWTAGRVIRAPVFLRRPARYLNEGLSDQERALARRAVTLVGTIKSASLVELVGRGPWWDEIAAFLRARTREALARHVRPRGEQSAAIATAILIGDRAGLDLEVERRLQEAGTYHVIAISGGNIAILSALILGTLARFGVRGRLGALVAIVMLASYALIASGGASVARATLMAIVYLAIRLIDQRTAAGNAIALTATLLLLIDPLSITDVAFWLTFGATTAILIGVSRVYLPAGSILRTGLAVLLASVCAELALAPIGAIVFQRVTLAGLLLNFIALPAMTLVQIGSMVVVMLDAIRLNLLADWAGQVVNAGSVTLTGSSRFLDIAPWLTWRVPSPRIGVVVLYYAAIIVALAGSHGRACRSTRAVRSIATMLAGGCFLWVIVAPPARVRARGDGRLHVTQIDVGQGDALLVTLPHGRHLVVDTGGVTTRGEFDVGDRVVAPSLRARGILGFDYLAVTHGDPDHIGGARALVRDFQPMEIWSGVPVANHEPSARLRAEADRVGTAWRTLQRGDRLEIEGVEIRVHHPPLPDWERQKVRNDDSLVLELRFGEVSLLLTGDISRDIERELLPTLDLLPIRILKVAHHGSGTSSAMEFVEQLKPQIALIGVGRGNPYGHPVPYVLERLTRVGTRVFRTDVDGQVHLVTDGKEVEVTTFTGRAYSSQHEEHEGR